MLTDENSPYYSLVGQIVSDGEGIKQYIRQMAYYVLRDYLGLENDQSQTIIAATQGTNSYKKIINDILITNLETVHRPYAGSLRKWLDLCGRAEFLRNIVAHSVVTDMNFADPEFFTSQKPEGNVGTPEFFPSFFIVRDKNRTPYTSQITFPEIVCIASFQRNCLSLCDVIVGEAVEGILSKTDGILIWDAGSIDVIVDEIDEHIQPVEKLIPNIKNITDERFIRVHENWPIYGF